MQSSLVMTSPVKIGIMYDTYMHASAKTGLTCIYTHLMNHNFSCELASNITLTSFTVLVLFPLVSNLHANSLFITTG